MVRVGPFILLLTLAAAPASAKPPESAEAWRLHDPVIADADPDNDAGFAKFRLGDSGRFGLGVFGLKSSAPRSRAVTGSEVSAPKQRRAGVGFSLKF